MRWFRNISSIPQHTRVIHLAQQKHRWIQILKGSLENCISWPQRLSCTMQCLLLCAFEALSLQETQEANEFSLNMYRNIVYRLHWKRQKSPKPVADIRAVAQPECKSVQTVLSLSICKKELLIVVLKGIKSATNRKSSRGSSELLWIISLSSSWLLTAGSFGEPRINWALWRSAYYLPIEDPRVISGAAEYNEVI